MDWFQTALAVIPALLGLSIIWLRVEKILNALKECTDVLTSIIVSFDDKSISKEELQNIRKEGLEAIAAIKGIFT